MITRENAQQKLALLTLGPDLSTKLLRANALEFAACALMVNDYLSYRAEAVGDDYNLLPGHFLAWLLMGERCFFGVHVCSSHMRPTRDDEEPYRGCLEEWSDFTEDRMAHEELSEFREMLGEAGVACPPLEPHLNGHSHWDGDGDC
jgi:hypothetical protein